MCPPKPRMVLLFPTADTKECLWNEKHEVPVWTGHPRWAWRHFLDGEEAILSWRSPASSRKSWLDTVLARSHTALQCFSKEDEGLTVGFATSDTQSSLSAPPWTAAAGCMRASAALAPGCPPLHPPRCCCPSSPCAGCRQCCKRWRKSSQRLRCRQVLSHSPHEVPLFRWCLFLWAGWRFPGLNRCCLPTPQCRVWGRSSRHVHSLELAHSGCSGLFHKPSSSQGCRTSTPDASSGGCPARLWG